MKDIMSMSKLTQDDFLRAKAVLDKTLRRVGNLADDAREASLECCSAECAEEDQGSMYDARDQFRMVSSRLKLAEAYLDEARAIAGRISVPDRITRDGGT